MSNKLYNLSVQNADAAFKQWCKEQEIPLHGIEHVITWEEWDDGIGVYFFLQNIQDVTSLRPEKSQQMKDIYLKFLLDSEYPFEKFPNVVFEVDSDENVRKKYGGSYFNRLR